MKVPGLKITDLFFFNLFFDFCFTIKLFKTKIHICNLDTHIHMQIYMVIFIYTYMVIYIYIWLVFYIYL